MRLGQEGRWAGFGPELRSATNRNGRVERVSVEIEAQVTGNVWKVEKAVGDAVEEEDVILIIESMKMEIPVEAPCAGRIAEIRTAEGEGIEEGDVLVVLD